MMKKIIYNQFGNADVLQITQTAKPTAVEKCVLVKVKSVSINPLDWKIFGGEMKMVSGSKFPKGVGIDFSGVIEEVGKNVESFQKGDEVFGLMDIFKGGALAEYIVVNESNIAIKPNNISFDQAAVLSVAGSSALQIFDKLAQLEKGAKVLINGASGGIGMFAVQVAKNKGAHVTTVTSARGILPIKQWGADESMDYKTQNFLEINEKFDVVVDLSGTLAFKNIKLLLKNKATFISTIPSPLAIIKSAVHNLFSSTRHKILILKPSKEYLQNLGKLAANGLKIHIGQSYMLNDFRKAFEETESKGAVGKNTISLS